MALRKFIGDVLDRSGNVVVGASVRVRVTGTQTLATLYEDDETTPISNPTSTNSRGAYYFNIANGVYDIDIVVNGATTTLTKMQMDAVDGTVGAVVSSANDAATARAALALGTSATHAAEDFIGSGEKDAANGVAPLDADSKVPLGNLPAIYLTANTTRYDLLPVYGFGSNVATPYNLLSRDGYGINESWERVGTATYDTDTGVWSHLIDGGGGGHFGFSAGSGSGVSIYRTLHGDPGIRYFPKGVLEIKNLYVYAYGTPVSGTLDFTATVFARLNKVSLSGDVTLLSNWGEQVIATELTDTPINMTLAIGADVPLDPSDRLEILLFCSVTSITGTGIITFKMGEMGNESILCHPNIVLPISTSPLLAASTIQGNPEASAAYPKGMTGAQAAAIVLPSLPIGLRDKIINGCFRKWDYATIQTSSGYGSDNMWSNYNSGTTKSHVLTSWALGDNTVPGNLPYYSATVVTSVAGAGNYCTKRQAIEGVRTLSGKTATLSFWAKADASKNMAVEFCQNFGSGGSPSAGVTGIGSQLIALTTTWTKYTVTVAIPAITGKTLGTAGDFLELILWFDAGSSFNARAASLGQQSGTFSLARVRLCEGSADCDNDPDVDVGTLVRQCARYLPMVSNGNTYTALPGVGIAASTTKAYVNVPFMVPARSKVSGISISGASDFRLSDFYSPVVASGVAYYDASAMAASIDITVASGLTQWRTYMLHSANSTSAKILFTGAEL